MVNERLNPSRHPIQPAGPLVGGTWLLSARINRPKDEALMGYTPLFDSLVEGTLYAKWPDIGLWPVLLSMADYRGCIDKTPEYISGVTGLELSSVIACIARFCAPDPRSRSKVSEGRRLELIDPERDWGWRVINIGVYRQKAAGLNQVADGRNAEKVRRYKERKALTDTNGHHETPATPHSDSDSDSNSNKEKEPANAGTPKPVRKKSNKTAISESFELTGAMLAFALEHLPNVDTPKLFDGFRTKAKAKGWKYVDWEQAWQEFVRNSAPGSGHWAANSYPKTKGNKLAI